MYLVMLAYSRSQGFLLTFSEKNKRDILSGFGQVSLVAPEFRDENRKCKLAAISMRFIAAMSQRFRTCSKLHATW